LSARRSLRVPRQVLVYLFRRRAELEFLLLRRTERHGGFWQGVTGAPEWEESDVEGAVREVLEETGFVVADRIAAADVRYEILRESYSDRVEWERLYGPNVPVVPEEVYVAEVLLAIDPTLAPNEHDDFRWCTLEEALELLKWDTNREALVVAHDFIRARKPTRRSAP